MMHGQKNIKKIEKLLSLTSRAETINKVGYLLSLLLFKTIILNSWYHTPRASPLITLLIETNFFSVYNA